MIPGPGPCHWQPAWASVHMYKQVWPLPSAMHGGWQCWQSSREKGCVLQVDADKWFWLALQITGWRNSFQLKYSTLLLSCVWYKTTLWVYEHVEMIQSYWILSVPLRISDNTVSGSDVLWGLFTYHSDFFKGFFIFRAVLGSEQNGEEGVVTSHTWPIPVPLLHHQHPTRRHSCYSDDPTWTTCRQHPSPQLTLGVTVLYVLWVWTNVQGQVSTITVSH